MAEQQKPTHYQINQLLKEAEAQGITPDMVRSELPNLAPYLEAPSTLGAGMQNLGARGAELGGNFLTVAKKYTDTVTQPLQEALSPVTDYAKEHVPQEWQKGLDDAQKEYGPEALGQRIAGSIPRDTYYAEQYENEDLSVGNVYGLVASEGLASVADMAVNLTPVGRAVYMASETERLAQDSAKNDNRTELESSDYLRGAGGAAINTAMETIGGRFTMGDAGNSFIREGTEQVGNLTMDVAEKTGANVLGEIGKKGLKAGAVEGGTEFVQEGSEYAFTHAGTETGADWETGLKQAGTGAVVGGVLGSHIRGGLTGYQGATVDKQINALNEGKELDLLNSGVTSDLDSQSAFTPMRPSSEQFNATIKAAMQANPDQTATILQTPGMDDMQRYQALQELGSVDPNAIGPMHAGDQNAAQANPQVAPLGELYQMADQRDKPYVDMLLRESMAGGVNINEETQRNILSGVINNTPDYQQGRQQLNAMEAAPAIEQRDQLRRDLSQRIQTQRHDALQQRRKELRRGMQFSLARNQQAGQERRQNEADFRKAEIENRVDRPVSGFAGMGNREQQVKVDSNKRQWQDMAKQVKSRRKAFKKKLAIANASKRAQLEMDRFYRKLEKQEQEQQQEIKRQEWEKTQLARAFRQAQEIGIDGEFNKLATAVQQGIQQLPETIRQREQRIAEAALQEWVQDEYDNADRTGIPAIDAELSNTASDNSQISGEQDADIYQQVTEQPDTGADDAQSVMAGDGQAMPLDDGRITNDETISPVDAGANEAATSPTNERPEPTEAQIKAGNYKKGKVKLHGLDISIENPKGSVRRGVDDNGEAWETTMQHHYGDIKTTTGADGDPIDVFVGDKSDSEKVFVIDQVNPATGQFDEVKAMVGFDSIEEAEQAYRANYDKNWQGLGAITETSVSEFKAWTKRPRKSKQAFAPAEKQSAKADAIDFEKASAKELAAHFEKQDGTQYRETTQQDWGTLRGQGKRRGKMVTGGMFDSTLQGKKHYTNLLGKLKQAEPDNYEDIKLMADGELQVEKGYSQARAAGADHDLAVRFALSKSVKSPESFEKMLNIRRKPEAQPKQTTAAKQDDWGEEIKTARKNIAQKWRDTQSDDDISSQPLSKTWPVDAFDDIDNTFASAFAFAVRSEIPRKPTASYKRGRWVEKVKGAKQLVKDSVIDGLLSGRLTVDQIKDAANRLGLSEIINKVEILAELDRKHWGKIDKIVSYPDSMEMNPATNKFDIPKPKTLVRIANQYREFPTVDPKEVAKAIEPVLENTTTDKPAMKFEVRGRKGSYSINKKGDPEYTALATFTTSREALDFVRDENAKLVEAWESHKERVNVKKSDIRGKTNRPRTGADYRNGKDVTAEDFENTFGIHRGTFGKWVKEGAERQNMLNGAYDALMDLASITGLPPRALSLEGKLGFAFGSNGRGKAMAHYEPGEVVINLTKTKGAGSLAHEWFHALDNYFQKKRSDWPNTSHGGFITHNPETYYLSKSGHALSESRFKDLRVHNRADWKRVEGVRPKVANAFASLVKTLNGLDFAKRSSRLDKGKANGYWSSNLEMAARAFESYVIAKMNANGYHNDFLANITAENEFIRARDRYPYIKADEIGDVETAFDGLFDTIESKQTDDGEIALFRASGESPVRLGDDNNVTGNSDTGTVSLADANRVINRIVSGWNGGIEGRRGEIVIASTFNDLPSSIKDAAKAQGAEGQVYGVFHKGKTYVVLDKHGSTQELETTIFHETYGHHGLRKLFGKEINTKLNQLFTAMGGMSGLRKLSDKHGIDLQMYIDGTAQAGIPQAVRNRIMVEELLAHIQQDNKPSVTRLAKELVGRIRQKLRDLGFVKLAKVSDSDLFYTLKQSRDAVKKGSVKSGGIRFMRKGVTRETLIREGLGDAREVAYQEDRLTQLKESDNPFDVKAAVALEEKLTLANEMFHSGNEEIEPEADSKTLEFSPVADGIVKDIKGYLTVTMDLPGDKTISYRVSKTPDEYGEYVVEEKTDGDWEYSREESSLQSFIEYADDQASFAGHDVNNASVYNDDYDFSDVKNETRFSLGVTAPKKSKAAKQKFTEKAMSMVNRFGRKFMFKLLPVNQMADIYDKGYTKGHINRYYNLLEDFGAYKSNELTKLDEGIETRWDDLQKMKPKANNLMSRTMVNATMLQISPDVEFANQEVVQDLQKKIDDLEARPTLTAKQQKYHDDLSEQMLDLTDMYKQVRDDWQWLENNAPEAVQLYKDVRQTYQDMYANTKKFLDQRIKELQTDEQTKGQLMTLVKKQFELQIQKGDYFPLQRHGQFAVMATKTLPNGETDYIREHFESDADANAAAERYEAEGYKVTNQKMMDDTTRKPLEGYAMGQEILKQVKGIQDANEATANSFDFDEVKKDVKQLSKVFEAIEDKAESTALMDTIYQQMLMSLPNASAAKRFIHRNRVKGASTDSRRAFADTMFHSINRAAKIQYEHKFAKEIDAIGELADTTSGKDQRVIRDIHDSLVERNDKTMNPDGSQAAAMASGLGFNWLLGGSVAAGAVNLSQVPLVTFPYLSSKYGNRKATAAMAGAMNDVMTSSKVNVKSGGNAASTAWKTFSQSDSLMDVTYSKKLTKVERAILQQLTERGKIDLTQMHSMAQIADTETRDNHGLKLPFTNKTINRKSFRDVQRAWGFFFHNAEVFNRQVTALSTMRLAMDKDPNISEQKLYDLTAKSIDETQFNYAAHNRGMWARTDSGKIFLMFLTYKVNMITLMAKNAKRMFANDPESRAEAQRLIRNLFLAHGVAAGALGMPVFEAVGESLMYLKDLVDGDDEPDDFRQFMDETIRSIVGVMGGDPDGELAHTLSTTTRKGVFNGLMGIDIHSRVGLNDLVWRSDSQVDKSGTDMVADALYGASPIFSITGNILNGQQRVAEGMAQDDEEKIMRGVQGMLPTALSNIVKATRRSAFGESTLSGTELMNADQLNGWHTVTQALGFGTEKIADMYERRSRQYTYDGIVANRKQTLVRKAADKVMNAGDLDEVIKSIAKFNKQYPAEAISADTIRRHIKAKIRRDQQTIDGIYRPKSKMAQRNKMQYYDN